MKENVNSKKNPSSNSTSNYNKKSELTDQPTKTNFQIFMDELLDKLRNVNKMLLSNVFKRIFLKISLCIKGNSYAKSVYDNILNQEKFLKCLNDVVKAVQREGGLRDKKVVKLQNFLNDTAKSSSKDFLNLVDFDSKIPLILDPEVKVKGIIAEKANMFKSNLMPCLFVFKAEYLSGDGNEYSTIYKIGDDLRQDQLVQQMIALMDKVGCSTLRTIN